MQYLPLKYSESSLLGTPVTQQPCVCFSDSKTEFSFLGQNSTEHDSAFFISTIFFPEVANRV